jgi:hypothetical protein
MKVSDARKFQKSAKFNVGAGIGATPTWGYCVFTYNRRYKNKKVSIKSKIYISKQSFISHNASSTIRALFFDQCKKSPSNEGRENKERKEMKHNRDYLLHLGNQFADSQPRLV